MVYSYKKAANLVNDCLPLPPIPTNNPFPPDNFNNLDIINKCSIANLNILRFMILSVLI